MLVIEERTLAFRKAMGTKSREVRPHPLFSQSNRLASLEL
jgi:hypothetical protein